MQAPSKITRKVSYTYVLNFLLGRSVHNPPVEALVDDV